ncbi:MAG TPA: hypothetical protein VNN72_02775, partial [Polyangiaceae bacterium]|nr:hypothetical protein [Polyangiaceae bacterium]
KTSWGRSVSLVAAVALAAGCSIFSDNHNSDDDDDGGDSGQSGEGATGGTSKGGTTGKGGTTSKGGSTSNGGSVSQGGGSARGGSSNGGSVADGGTLAIGGTVSNGGTGDLGSGGDLVIGGTGGDLGIGGTVSNGGTGGSVSNGGSGATGGGSGTGGGDPPSGECGDAFNVESGGYVTSPGTTCFHGYAFTAIDSFGTIIDPEEFGACASPSCLCASGTVIGDELFQSYASFGFNVNQEPILDAPELTTAPAGAGLQISYTNTGSSDLRVQIASGDTRFCYEPLVGTSGVITIPYSSFNTECWVGGDGAYFTPGTPITSIQLVMPSKATDVPFNVCLVSVRDE